MARLVRKMWELRSKKATLSSPDWHVMSLPKGTQVSPFSLKVQWEIPVSYTHLTLPTKA